MVWYNSYLHFLFPKAIEKCSRRSDICKRNLVVSTEFSCHATKRKYKIIDTLTCKPKNIICLIAFKCCSKQYIGSANGFKERFQIHKSGIDTAKIRCAEGNDLLSVWKSNICKTKYL